VADSGAGLLAGRTVLVIGGSSGIGLATARRAHAEAARVIVTGRDAARVQRAGLEVEGSIAAFDATNFEALGRFFDELTTPLDHVVVTAPGRYDGGPDGLGLDDARRRLEAHLLLPLQVAREAKGRVRPGGTLIFTGCTDGRRAKAGPAFISAITAALSAMSKSLAAELAPIRVNVIAVGFLEGPQSWTAPIGGRADRGRQLEAMLPIQQLVGPGDVAALAVHLMTNAAVTGATLEIDGGQHVAGL
jgi:NAD(P)-dependent dehydrogenase (short-subunit alcohol dehydrogenase family)